MIYDNFSSWFNWGVEMWKHNFGIMSTSVLRFAVFSQSLFVLRGLLIFSSLYSIFHEKISIPVQNVSFAQKHSVQYCNMKTSTEKYTLFRKRNSVSAMQTLWFYYHNFYVSPLMYTQFRDLKKEVMFSLEGWRSRRKLCFKTPKNRFELSIFYEL